MTELMPSEPLHQFSISLRLVKGMLCERSGFASILAHAVSAGARGGFKMKTQRALLSITASWSLPRWAQCTGAEESSTVLSPQALQEIVQVEAEIEPHRGAGDRATGRARAIRSSKSTAR